MDIKRRTLLTRPGESLLVSTSPVEAAIRAEQLSATTGIPTRSLLSNALCAIPLPMFPSVGSAGRRPWRGVRADAMWCPLLWLPERLATRLPVQGGPAGLESDDLWAVRVALELSATGVYDDVTGTWVDVLSLVGLDTDSADDIARVRRWLDGGSDTALDELDLTEHMYPDSFDAARSLDVAEKSLGPLRAAAWTYAADDLLDTCHDLILAHRAGVARNPGRLVVGTLIKLGTLAFAEAEGEIMWWASARTHFDQTAPEADIVEDMLPTIADHLAELRNLYAPMARMFSLSMRSISASS